MTGATGLFAAGNHHGGHGTQAIGQPGVLSKATRTIEVDMSDAMRFSPANIQAKQGETIRFVVKNSGQLSHEFVLGTAKDLKAHYEVMKKNPEMEHADDNMLTVKPGETRELLWQFTQAGTVDFACLHPGHYDAGMKGSVAVAAASAGRPAQPAMAMNGMKTVQDKAMSMGTGMDMKGMEMSDGEVRKIDKDTQKITLRHGEIKSMDMPGMTMVFRVADAAMLDAVKVGDKVKFNVEKRNGAMVITAMEHAQ